MLQTVDWLFFVIALITFCSSVGVVTFRNPIYSALSLALTMVFFAGLFFRLNAEFIAGVQLVVYAGAVMVLFVMVLMLFDLKQETKAFTKGLFTGALKLAATGFFCGYVLICAYFSTDFVLAAAKKAGGSWVPAEITKEVAIRLFTKYLFGFETIGVVLLVVAIGAVALSRIPGGTHAKH